LGTPRCPAAERWASTTWARRSTSTVGMSMRTGQASKHAPQRLEAYGSESVCGSLPGP
jgi:hypothetical protein